MVRNNPCIICGISLRCKERGNTKKYCPHCAIAIRNYYSESYRAKHIKSIRNVARKYREAHRETIRAQARKNYLRLKYMKKHYDQKLLDDLLKNPRKYLNRVKVVK